MSKIMWRESRCQPEVRSRTRDTGLLQINDINQPWLTNRMGTPVDANTLTDPELNVAAAAQLYRFWNNHTRNGYQPWKTQ
jgi:soluble lytic murein transglycosylase-like protein